MLYLGCHLSSSKGFAAMGRTALSIGANTFQFFTRNPRGGAAKEIVPADAAALVQMQDAGEIGRIVAHAPYTPVSYTHLREQYRGIFEDLPEYVCLVFVYDTVEYLSLIHICAPCGRSERPACGSGYRIPGPVRSPVCPRPSGRRRLEDR